MTIGEAIYRLWENAGEPTDLDPWLDTAVDYDPDTELDPNSQGVRYFLRALSDAQIELANWKTNGRRPIRFRDFQVSRNAKLTLNDTTYDCTRLTDTSIRISNPPAYLLTDAAESCRCDILHVSLEDGEETETEDTLMAMYLEPAADGSYVDIYFREEMEEISNYVRMEVTLLFDRFTITRGDRVYDSPYLVMPDAYKMLLKVTDAENSAPLSRAANKEHLYNPDMTTGTPSQWYSIGKKIYFDVYFEEPRWFTIEYMKIPDELTSLDQEFELPVAWHEVLIEMVEYLLAKRGQERELQAIKFSNVNRLISHMRTDRDDDFVRDETGGLKIRMK